LDLFIEAPSFRIGSLARRLRRDTTLLLMLDGNYVPRRREKGGHFDRKEACAITERGVSVCTVVRETSRRRVKARATGTIRTLLL
jgi:hypothetical protein